MSMDVIDAVSRHVLSSPLVAPDVTIVWHAGEPTTIPISWYEEAFMRLSRKPTPRLHHSFQTNGIAINTRWIEFWRRWNVRVGVSIDGPRDLNNLNRRTKRGGSSFDAAVAGVRRLKEKNYPFHVITVLGSASLEHPDDLVNFYLREDIKYVCFNVEEQEGQEFASTLAERSATISYSNFLKRIYQRLYRELAGPTCREIDGVSALIEADSISRQHNSQANPLEIVSISVTGDMSTFSPELLDVKSKKFNNFVFGNIVDQPVEAMLEHPSFKLLYDEILSGLIACKKACPYFGVCGGGAPANKFFENQDFASTETQYCRLTRKAVIDTVLREIEVDNVQ